MMRFCNSFISPYRRIGTVSELVALDLASGIGLSFSHAPSVGNGPGAVALRRMPYGPQSTASDIVIACNAVFAIAERTTNAEPDQTQVTRFLTTAPFRPPAIQGLPAAKVT